MRKYVIRLKISAALYFRMENWKNFIIAHHHTIWLFALKNWEVYNSNSWWFCCCAMKNSKMKMKEKRNEKKTFLLCFFTFEIYIFKLFRVFFRCFFSSFSALLSGDNDDNVEAKTRMMKKKLHFFSLRCANQLQFLQSYPHQRKKTKKNKKIELTK